MSEERHSPLPWSHRGGFETEIITDADEDIICRRPNHPENGRRWEADAKLIVRSVNGADLVRSLWEDIRIRGNVRKDYLELAEAIDKLVGGIGDE